MLAGVQVAPALVFAAQWLVACLLGAVVSWALLMFFLRRRLGTLSAHRGPLFAAIVIVAFAAANLYIEGRAFAMHDPLIAAPAQLLFLILFYIYPNPSYAGHGVRWLSILYAFAQVSAYIPQNPQKQPTNPQAAVVLAAPGVVGTLMVLGDMFALGPIVIGILPQLYSRSRRLAESQRQPHVSRRTWAVTISAGAVAAFVLLFVAGLLALPNLAAATSTAAAPPVLQVTRLGFFLLTSLAPVGIGFALLSGRHYDREALLHRALIDLALVASLLLVYAAGIAALNLLFPAYRGIGEYLPFILPIGALLALIYSPLRAQIETQIGQRFFRETYEAGQVFTAASPLLASETRPDQLCTHLVTTVEKALRPATVALWIQPLPSSAGGFRASGVFAPTAPLPAAAGHEPEKSAALDPAATHLRRYTRTSDAGAAPAGAATLTLGATDPAREYFQPPVRVVEMDRLPEDSPAVRTLRAAKARLALPLSSKGELEGVLALAPRPSARPYSADTRELLAELASVAAPALQAALTAQRRDVEAREHERVEQELQTARRIQESLLPKEMPALTGWQIATAYQPAREVGGDFYDFLPLGDGRLGIVLGDVTDKGIPAALVMATTRSMLRAVAVQADIAPDAVLAQVNDLLCPDLPASMFVTCFYAVLDPMSGRLSYANAGQDLPYRRHADGHVDALHATGMPLGMLPGSSYDTHEMALAPGDSLLFFSDGLVEAHNPAREMFGLPRVEGLLAGHDGGTAPIVALLHALADFTGTDWEQEDDITLVALRRSEGDASSADGSASAEPGAEEWRTLAAFTLPSTPGGEREAIARVSTAVAGLGLPAHQLANLQTAVGEAAMNAIEHGNRYQPELAVSIEVRAARETLVVRVTDQGSHIPIPPLTQQAPDLGAKLAEREYPRGWGLFLMRGLVDEVVASGDGTHHTVELRLALAAPAPDNQDDA